MTPNKNTFQALSDILVFVLGSDGNLWLEHAPFGTVPPSRQLVDSSVWSFQALSETLVLVLKFSGDFTLWLEHGPFGTVPPPSERVDGGVRAFQAVSDSQVFVLTTDGNLWLEQAPFVPTARQHVDSNVTAFEALSASEVLVLAADGQLWLEQAPFGSIGGPARQQVDTNVSAFQVLSSNQFLVLGSNGMLSYELSLTALGHYIPALHFAYNAGGPKVETASIDFNTVLKTALGGAAPAPDPTTPPPTATTTPPPTTTTTLPPTTTTPPPNATVAVPDLTGFAAATASKVLASAGLVAKFNGPTQHVLGKPLPTVVSQTPAANQPVDKGSTVTMVMQFVDPQ